MGYCAYQNRHTRRHGRDNQRARFLPPIPSLRLGVFELCRGAGTTTCCSRASDSWLVRHCGNRSDSFLPHGVCLERVASASACWRYAGAPVATIFPSSVQLVGSGGAGHPCVSSAPCRSGISATACTAGADRIVCTPDAGAVSLALCLAHRFTICVGHSVSADGDHSSTNGCCRILPCAKSRRASVDLARSAARSAPVGLPETSTDGRAHAVCS